MKLTTRELAQDALVVTLLIVGGYLLYFVSKVFPFPGGKFIVMAPYLTLVLYFPIARTKRVGTITLVNMAFAILLGFISFFMSVAIVLSGALTDAVALIVGGYRTEKHILFVLPLYAVFSLISSVYIADYITGSRIYGTFGIGPIAVMALVVYGLGLIGTFTGKWLSRRLQTDSQRRQP